MNYELAAYRRNEILSQELDATKLELAVAMQLGQELAHKWVSQSEELYRARWNSREADYLTGLTDGLYERSKGEAESLRKRVFELESKK